MDAKDLQNKLIYLEGKYSENGIVKNIKRQVFSKHEKNYRSVHQGADRMKSIYHNYSEWYSIFFQKYIQEKITFCEVGILTGVGLSIWCDIFKNANIIGYDIDTNIYLENYKNLLSLGAFSSNSPNVYSFDQYEENTDLIKNHINEKKITIVIDDGNHKTDANLQTFKSFLPLLADEFVYVIEDNQSGIHKKLHQQYNDEFYIYYKDQLTIITSKNGKEPINSLKKYLVNTK